MTMNAALVFEIAVLILAAFLLGAVIGALARWLIARPRAAAEPAAAPAPEATAAAAPATDDLVKAPAIAPLRAGPTAAERLAAAGGMTSTVVMPKLSLPEAPAIQPSRRPGETVSGRHIENPEHPSPPANPEPAPVAPAAPAPVAAAEIEPVTSSSVASDSVPAPSAAPAVADESQPEREATAETPLPVEDRVEPAVPPDDLVVLDPPAEVAAEIQDVVETEVAGMAPAVAAEAPLVEPVVERDQREASEAIESPIVLVAEAAPSESVVAANPAPASPASAAELPDDPVSPPAAPAEPAPTVAVDPAPPVAAAQAPAASAEAQPKPEFDDELAAMRAIEGGWRPRRPAAPRKPADLPEGVTQAHAAEADRAVEKSGAAVANALATAAAVLEEMAPAGRPAALSAPREGGKDDLSRIKGLAPAIESALNGLGIYHYDQVAGWDDSAVAWIETHFGFRGRIAREGWQEQARELAAATAPAPEAATR